MNCFSELEPSREQNLVPIFKKLMEDPEKQNDFMLAKQNQNVIR